MKYFLNIIVAAAFKKKKKNVKNPYRRDFEEEKKTLESATCPVEVYWPLTFKFCQVPWQYPSEICCCSF